MKIYYAHHQWKYGTQVEAYELARIKDFFPAAEIFNPAVSINQIQPPADVMEDCLQHVRNSDLVLFSALDGCIGQGVDRELREAFNFSRPVLYLHWDGIRLFSEKDYEAAFLLNGGKNPRLYKAII